MMRNLKSLVLLAALAAFPAHADLYRWVDPESGSVKLSSYPPPWFGDPERERRAPVAVIRYQQPAAAAEVPKPGAGKPAQESGILERLRPGLEARIATKPPAQK